ncbi:MAG: hypothetical protein Q7S63_01780 [bacterium]|nr:hypothetical protein [bacterium]
MVLGIEELHKLVKEKQLVEGLSQRELENPEGAGFDLRVGEIYEVEGQGFLGVTERETPSMKLLASFKEGETQEVLLKSHTYYTVKTVEDVNMPDDILALMTPRSTLFRSGVYCFGGQVPPGYKGGLTMGMYNFRDTDFRLEMGARIVHIMFFAVEGKGNMYRGQWQGGRVTTNEKETQV